MKWVSVIIPTFNRAALLKKSIQSVIEQTYRPVECIIVDDGSTDDTSDLIHEFKKLANDNFSINYIQKENSGVQAARNAGTAAAIGDFIQYLDSDDLLYPDKLKNQIEFLNHHPDCDGVFGDWQSGDEKKSEMLKAFASNDLIAQFLTDRCIANFSFLMRKEIVKKTGDWDITVKRNQEIDFHVRAVLAGGNFEYQGITTGLWRTHDEPRIANTTGLSDFHYFFNKMKILLSEKGLFTKELSTKIAGMYVWFLNLHWHESQVEIYRFCLAIVKLEPERKLYSNKKWDLFFAVFGRKLGLKFWIAIIKLRKRFSSKTNFTA
jgi:glycosyltransferase involved in cell wall biosynthesis